MLQGIPGRAMGWLLIAVAVAVCSAQTMPQPQSIPSFPSLPSDSSAALVLSLTGQVSVLRDSVPWALRAGDSVSAGKVILTGSDGYAVFQVSDGSTFEVFPNSRVTFRNNPSNWKDLLDVWLGRIKVHIQKWGGAPNHNRIHTPTAVISVRGTIFDVAVEEDDSTTVAVEEGQVAVRHRLIGHEKDKLLGAGEHIKVFRDVPIARSTIHKGEVAERSLNALADIFYSIILRGGSRASGVPGSVPGSVPGGAGGGAPLPGDTPAEPPPPPPPPPGDAGSTPPPPPGD